MAYAKKVIKSNKLLWLLKKESQNFSQLFTTNDTNKEQNLTLTLYDTDKKV